MLIIIEVILTIVAWIRGWKWLSLIPIGSAFFLGMLSGSIIASLGEYPTNIISFIWIDILAVIALLIMIVKPKKKPKPPTV